MRPSRYVLVCLTLTWIALAVIGTALVFVCLMSSHSAEKVETLQRRLDEIETRPAIYQWKEEDDARHRLDKSGAR